MRCGLHSALEKTFALYPFMKLFFRLLQRHVLTCWYSMVSQAATLCLPLVEEEKTAWETWKVFPEVSDAFLEEKYVTRA